jgi:microcystin-dependent protein
MKSDYDTLRESHVSMNAGLVPVGAVVALTGSLASGDRYVPCEGQLLSRTEYAELFAVVGHTYGGSGDQFALPDMRGLVLRGIGKRVVQGREKAGPTRPGDIQEDAVQEHDHAVAVEGHRHQSAVFSDGPLVDNGASGPRRSGWQTSEERGEAAIVTTDVANDRVTVGAIRNARSASETRVAAMGVRWCIRVR